MAFTRELLQSPLLLIQDFELRQSPECTNCIRVQSHAVLCHSFRIRSFLQHSFVLLQVSLLQARFYGGLSPRPFVPLLFFLAPLRAFSLNMLLFSATVLLSAAANIFTQAAPTVNELDARNLDAQTQINFLSNQGLLNLKAYRLLNGGLLSKCNDFTVSTRQEWSVQIPALQPSSC